MDCDGANACGVLAVVAPHVISKSDHVSKARVHGLWPQVPPYGNSQCLPPSGSHQPLDVATACYAKDLCLQSHEWYVPVSSQRGGVEGKGGRTRGEGAYVVEGVQGGGAPGAVRKVGCFPPPVPRVPGS